MAKLTERKTETEKATQALTDQFKALSTIATLESEKKVQEKKPEVTQKKKDQLVTFQLPAEDYERYKMWFGSKGVSMSMGIRMCLDYVNFQDNSKKVVLSKSGIREVALNLM